MSYKNSAGVKFNKDTELIIRADEDGTVESCYNIANDTEYVGGGGGDFTTCKMTLVDETAETLGVNMSLPLVMEDEGMTYLIAQLLSWPAGEYTVALCKGYAVGETNTSGVVDIAVTGDAQWNDGVLIVTGDFTLTGTDHS